MYFPLEPVITLLSNYPKETMQKIKRHKHKVIPFRKICNSRKLETRQESTSRELDDHQWSIYILADYAAVEAMRTPSLWRDSVESSPGYIVQLTKPGAEKCVEILSNAVATRHTWLFTFILVILMKLKIRFLSHNSHILGAQHPQVTCGYHAEQTDT